MSSTNVKTMRLEAKATESAKRHPKSLPFADRVVSYATHGIHAAQLIPSDFDHTHGMAQLNKGTVDHRVLCTKFKCFLNGWNSSCNKMHIAGATLENGVQVVHVPCPAPPQPKKETEAAQLAKAMATIRRLEESNLDMQNALLVLASEHERVKKEMAKQSRSLQSAQDLRRNAEAQLAASQSDARSLKTRAEHAEWEVASLRQIADDLSTQLASLHAKPKPKERSGFIQALGSLFGEAPQEPACAPAPGSTRIPARLDSGPTQRSVSSLEAAVVQGIASLVPRFVFDNAVTPSTVGNPCLTGESKVWRLFRAGALAAGFATRESALESGQWEVALHGTPDVAVAARIMQNGFGPKTRTRQVHGPGEYFDLMPSHAKQYAGDRGVVLVCIILSGEWVSTPPTKPDWRVVRNPTDGGKTFCLPVAVIAPSKARIHEVISAVGPAQRGSAAAPVLQMIDGVKSKRLEFEASPGQWAPVDQEFERLVLDGPTVGLRNIAVAANRLYHVDLSRMVQVNQSTGVTRKIRFA